MRTKIALGTTALVAALWGAAGVPLPAKTGAMVEASEMTLRAEDSNEAKEWILETLPDAETVALEVDCRLRSGRGEWRLTGPDGHAFLVVDCGSGHVDGTTDTMRLGVANTEGITPERGEWKLTARCYDATGTYRVRYRGFAQRR